jgi:uncharacterized hydrophobic protein (TIGR00271 family)
MLASHVEGAAMYWLQLVLAMAIATLGLALGSSAVVLGAMLMSPLMTPIVELGMGLAVGSPLLVVRSFWRVAVSVAVVLAGATLITVTLPFHEVTGPIASRTAPTALDLLVSIGCALMASFAVVTSRSNATTTAAGTAVAIALVPPLCVVGFGLGTRQLALARGAGLLFVASFSAIMLFAVLTFTVLGFGELDAAELERVAVSDVEVRSTGVARMRRLLGTGSGGLLRLVLPLLLLALVYLPLRRALEEVAWEVHARQAAANELRAITQEIVRSSVDVADHRLRVEIVVVGNPERATSLERGLSLRLSAATGVVPEVHAVAVPSADAMSAAFRVAPAPKPEAIVLPDLARASGRLSETLAQEWPSDAAGALVEWHLDVDSKGGADVDVVHLGAALGAPGEQMLARALSAVAGEAVTVRDVVLPSQPVSAAASEGEAWLARLSPVLDEVARYEGLYACIGVPPAQEAVAGEADGGDGAPTGVDWVRNEVTASTARVSGGRARVVPETSWTFRIQTEACRESAHELDGGEEAEATAPPLDASIDAR